MGEFMTCYEAVIIGAGFAGLSCASHLYKNGLKDILILGCHNAEERKLNSEKFSHLCGPSFLHGITKNPLAPIILDELKLEIFPSVGKSYFDQENIICLVDGKDMTNEFLSSMGEFEICLNEVEFEMTNSHRINVNSLDFFNSIVDLPLNKTLNFCGWNNESVLNKLVQIIKCEIVSGAEMENLSTASKLCWRKDEEILLILDPKGYDNCLDKIIESSRLSSEKILSDHLVVSIEEIHEKNEIRVKCSNGKIFTCKNTILAVPVNVLKSKMIKFHPPLSEDKIRALDNFEIASCVKVFVGFTHVFWHNYPILIIHNEEKENAFPNLVFWQNLNFHYNEKSNYLVSHAYGCAAEKVLKMSTQEITIHIKDLFSKAYPNQANQVEIKNVTVHLIEEGSFPYARPGLGRKYLEDLFKPEMNGKLHFSGDYLNIWKLGSKQAAYENGIEVANRVLNNKL